MAKKSRSRRSPRKRSRRRRGGRLGRTLAKAVVPFGLFMTQKHMQKRRSRKGRKTRRR